MNETNILIKLNSFCKNNFFLSSTTVSICFKTDISTGIHVNDYGELYINWNNDEMQFETENAIVGALAHEVMHCCEIEERMYEYSLDKVCANHSVGVSEFLIFQALLDCYQKKQYDNYLTLFPAIDDDFLYTAFLEGLAFYTEEEFKRVENAQYSEIKILTYYFDKFANGEELHLCKYLCGYIVLLILDDILPKWQSILLDTRCNPFSILYSCIASK